MLNKDEDIHSSVEFEDIEDSEDIDDDFEINPLIEDIFEMIEDSGVDFSLNARVSVISYITEHMTDIITESVNTAKRHGHDIVSNKHVNIANGYLVGDGKKRSLYFYGTIGSIFIGYSLNQLSSVFGQSIIDKDSLFISIILLVLGSVVMIYCYVKDN